MSYFLKKKALFFF